MPFVDFGVPGSCCPEGMRCIVQRSWSSLAPACHSPFPRTRAVRLEGVPTAHSAGALAAEFGRTDPCVWPSAEGRARGASVMPLYPSAPATADRNPGLYELLTLVDVLRLGRARERARAKVILRERILADAPDGAPA